MMAWVPTTNLASPLSIKASMARRSLVFWVPVSHAVVMPKGSNQPKSLRKCCSAKISVGAIKAHCHPASMQTAAASAATTVLPAPTSPCNKRCMGTGRLMSSAISRLTRSCAPVNANGRLRSKRPYKLFSESGGSKAGARNAARSRRDCN